MDKKKKKRKKIPTCIDCNEETNNYYRVQTNRGDIIKCRDCYELWLIRENRANWFSNQTQGRISQEE